MEDFSCPTKTHKQRGNGSGSIGLKDLLVAGNSDESKQRDRITVNGVVFFDDSFRAEGEVRLIDAILGGKLDCRNATFKNPLQPTGGGVALNADRVSVKAGIFLSSGFLAEGEVRLVGANVRGDLVCAGGTFRNHPPPGINSSGDALSADTINVTSSVLLNKASSGNGFRAEGNVRFLDARIGGIINCDGGHFEMLNLERANIKDVLFWTDIQENKDLALDLTNTSVAALSDDARSWPSTGNLFLNGFLYERISMGPTDAESRLDWLTRQTVLRPHPFRQLARVLKELGDEDGARKVLVEMERRRRVNEWTSPFLRLTTWFPVLDFTG